MSSPEKGFSLNLTLREGFEFDVDFEMPAVEDLLVDEPPPLGEGNGPNAARLVGAAVGNCLGASLLFCLRRSKIQVEHLEVKVQGTLVRNESGRLRIGGIDVRLEPTVSLEDRHRMQRCLDVFEDYCIVTESVRGGIDVNVDVAPSTSPSELVVVEDLTEAFVD